MRGFPILAGSWLPGRFRLVFQEMSNKEMSINNVITRNNIFEYTSFWWIHVMSYPIGSMGLICLPINSSQKINYSCIEKTCTTPMGSYKYMSYMSHVFPLVRWPRHRLLRAVKFLAGPEVSALLGVNFWGWTFGVKWTTGWWSESFGEPFRELHHLVNWFLFVWSIPIDFTWTMICVVPFFFVGFQQFFGLQL